jgi:hypothetical protein
VPGDGVGDELVRDREAAGAHRIADRHQRLALPTGSSPKCRRQRRLVPSSSGFRHTAQRSGVLLVQADVAVRLFLRTSTPGGWLIVDSGGD